jgi:fatty acid desaturase
MLPIPLAIERDAIPSDLKRAVQALYGARPFEFTVTLILAWLVIFAAIAAAQRIDTWWATLLAVIVIATRMNILGLLVHDQAHMSGYRNRFGDLLVNLFCAYPLILLTVEGYAQVHLAHHRDYFTKDDPDHLRKSGAEWAFPKTIGELLKIALRDITGLNAIDLARGKRVAKGGERFKRRGINPKWARPLFLVSVLAILITTGTWKLALLYWLLPLLTVMQLIVRWGALCEHEYNREGASVIETTPLIEQKWWERILLPNLNFTLHIYHHYFPAVAFSSLPKVHRMFKEAGLVNEDAIFHGYGDYLRRSLIKPSSPG